MEKKIKIVATLGPASDNINTIKEMVLAGVNVFRLNFSHGTHEYHKENIQKVREVEKELDTKIGILQDICGPKIRIGKLEEKFELKPNDRLDIYTQDILGVKVAENHYKTSINQPQILKMLQKDQYIYLYDGNIRAKVVSVDDTMVQTVVKNSGVLNSNKGVNFPNTRLGIEVITPKDRADMEFGAEQKVDFVAISFVQNADDVKKAKDILNSLGSKARLLSKIEKFDAVENIDDIIKISDGIMIARGDLGIEIPYYEVPTIQKSIIKKANIASKPVITATQMMLSMAEHETATRAEISDVANAVLDGTDAVMLSEESAVGINPIAVVKAMSNTILQAQKIYPYNKFDQFEFLDETDMVASSAAALAYRLNADAIISITGSGKSAIKIARNRVDMDIIAVTHDPQISGSLTLAWGVSSANFVLPKCNTITELLMRMVKEAFKNKIIDIDKTYLVTAGFPTGVEGSTNFMRILRKEQIEHYLSL
ncbi:pyruvate kinase [Campylobacter pinnipediorum]|uniref:pyruvate kinase n=1 Tax=Campylobacter pinnipediorum TaxID=1965231 RepID=UPI000995D0E0|nr:pyruvate kinase [Campylobacter pinnipediorum]AQW83100.1 pyruvate kinase I [Campylobacter pinnipediorum subsp. pinnipediorum]